MVTAEEKAQKILVELLATFSKRVITSGFCKWVELEIKSVDVWQSRQNRNKYDELIIILQHTNSNLRHLTLGINDGPSTAAKKIGKSFIRDAEDIKQHLLDFISTYPVPLNIELWAHELIRALSNISGTFDTEFRKLRSEL